MTTATPTQTTERTSFGTLAMLRDELKVQMHLAKAELRDEWNHKLEPRFWDLKTKLDRIEEASAETATELGSAIKLLIDELQEGYERIRKSL
jgi:hypothetical protein